MMAHACSRRLRIGTAILLFIVTGCSSEGDPVTESSVPARKVAVSKPVDPSTNGVADETFVPFDQAVRLEPPDDELRPPDVTAAGKVTAKLFEQIAGKDYRGGLWEQVKFRTADGKRLKHFATLRTDAGAIKIELLDQSAPNHVRSFICLARAGYFDGLPFHASIRRGDKESLQGYLESGCPKGTGEIGYGSIGYWLKPEIKSAVNHEEGTVGAWHPGEIDRVACRFYITLNRAPAFDGNYTAFGKVVHGLDVAHTINKRPVQDEQSPGPAAEPYRIRQVVIEQALAGPD